MTVALDELLFIDHAPACDAVVPTASNAISFTDVVDVHFPVSTQDFDHAVEAGRRDVSLLVQILLRRRWLCAKRVEKVNIPIHCVELSLLVIARFNLSCWMSALPSWNRQ